MSGHTQGKLIVRGGFSIYAADGKTPVADACLNDSVATHDEANARRLVACWNACDGISTETLELVPRFTEAGIKTVQSVEAQRDSLRAVNAELLDALTNLMRNFPTDHDMNEAGWDGSDIEKACSAHDAARAAIASARKQGEQG